MLARFLTNSTLTWERKHKIQVFAEKGTNTTVLDSDKENSFKLNKQCLPHVALWLFFFFLIYWHSIGTIVNFTVFSSFSCAPHCTLNNVHELLLLPFAHKSMLLMTSGPSALPWPWPLGQDPRWDQPTPRWPHFPTPSPCRSSAGGGPELPSYGLHIPGSKSHDSSSCRLAGGTIWHHLGPLWKQKQVEKKQNVLINAIEITVTATKSQQTTSDIKSAFTYSQKCNKIMLNAKI